MYLRSTSEALSLKKELEKRGVIVEAEKYDGHKHIDLVISRAHLNIEVDGNQHYETSAQILSDLLRTKYSAKAGWGTLHIPNILIHRDLEKVADALANAAIRRSNDRGHRFDYR